MRRRRALLPALAVAVLWVASDLLAQFSLASPGLLQRTLLRAVAPDTMTVAAAAPWPLGVLAALAWSGAVAAAFLLVCAVLRPEPSRSGFAAVWFAAIAAAVLVQGALGLALALGGLIDPAARAQISLDPLYAAAYWGLVWGWLPALLSSPLTPGASRRTRQPRRSRLAPTLVALVLALVALVVLVPSAESAWHGALAAQEEEPEPLPTGVPVPEIAPGDWQVDPLWCTENQLSLAAGEPDVAAGSRALTVTAKNISQAACVLEGYPDVAFGDQETGLIEVRVQHGSSMGGTDVGPVLIRLAPEESAVASIAWRAMPTDGLAAADWLHLAPYHGGLREMLPIRGDVTGGEVVVGAWRTPQEQAPLS